MLQDDYFIIDSVNDASYPIFRWDQPRGSIGLGSPVSIQEPLKFKLGDPIPENYQWADFHVSPKPLISERLAKLLASLNIYGIQLLPAKVADANNPFPNPKDYYFLHVFNRISCTDKDKSQFDEYDDGTIFGFDSLVLNETALSMVQPEHRMIFELAEDTSVLIIHRSLKNAIEEIKPSGLRFFKVSEWNSDCDFTN